VIKLKFEVKGFDELNKQLKKLKKAVNDLSKEKNVSLDKLFTSKFMMQYTNFSNFEEFLSAGNFVVNSQEDFESIPESELNAHVRKTTKFSSWRDMLNKAGEIYLSSKFKS